RSPEQYAAGRRRPRPARRDHGVHRIGGATFAPVGGTAGYADPSAVSPEPYLTISRNTGCLDQGQPGGDLAHGESNFLAVGTTLHRIAGSEPHEALAVWRPLIEEWEVLRPHGS
ncbi:MAG: hypothetical protein KFH98_15420, partial [Gemmatimonadetes bacterium]|nr:hypothetical protein [Gemmatimonadota bacterium]